MSIYIHFQPVTFAVWSLLSCRQKLWMCIKDMTNFMTKLNAGITSLEKLKILSISALPTHVICAYCNSQISIKRYQMRIHLDLCKHSHCHLAIFHTLLSWNCLIFYQCVITKQYFLINTNQKKNPKIETDGTDKNK